MRRRREFSVTEQPRIYNTATFADTQPFYTPEDSCEINELDAEEAKTILDSTEIHGDPVKENINQEKTLAIETLKKAGLEPKYLTKIGDAKIAFSQKYEGIGRMAIVAYVNDGDRYVARTFYLSNSHGIWKYLPNYSAYYDEADEYGLHYGKGFSENSIDLPLVAQDKIFEFGNDEAIELDEQTARAVFLGTARRSELSLRDTYNFSTLSVPMKITGNFYPEKNKDDYFAKISPEQLIFIDKQQAPNFQNKIKSWSASTKIYGKVEFTLYGSHDKKIVYLFCRDEKNRAWVGGIENGSPIQTTGVRMQWMDGGDLLTPAYEYTRQTGGYGDPDDRPAGQRNYVDMFNNYLSKVSVIQEYLKSLK